MRSTRSDNCGVGASGVALTAARLEVDTRRRGTESASEAMSGCKESEAMITNVADFTGSRTSGRVAELSSLDFISVIDLPNKVFYLLY